MLIQLIELTILIGGIQGLFVGLVHLFKRLRFPWDPWMALLLLSFAPSNLFLLLLRWQENFANPSSNQLLMVRLILLLPLNLILFPTFFLFVYVKQFTQAEKTFLSLTAVLKWAAIIELLGYLLPFGAALYLSSFEGDMVRFTLSIKKVVNIISIPFAIAIMIAIRALLARYRQQTAHLPVRHFGYRIQWIQFIFWAFVLIFSLVTLPLIYRFAVGKANPWLYFLQGIASTVVLFWLGLKSVFIDSRIALDNTQAIDNPVLPPLHPTQQRIYQDVLRLLTDEQLYKDPSLKLTDLAERLHLTPNYLSRIINQEAKKNASDLFNEYRVTEVKRLLIDPAFQHYTLESLGREAGFGAKSTFQAVFKKSTRLTPSQYRDNQRLKL